MKPLNTHYDTLQVPRKANDAALQTAFKTLCEQYHPDKDPDDLAGASPEMRALSEAYAVLSDSDKRFAYDLSLTKREREMRAEEEERAAKAAASMFPPIVMPDLPAPEPAAASAPSQSSPAVVAHVPAQPTPAREHQTARVMAPGARAKRPAADDFAPTTADLSLAQKSGFADTQPQLAADAVQLSAARDKAVYVPGHPAVEWLRERPAAMLGVLVLAIAVVALAPWMLRMLHMLTQPKTPVITPDLHPTYVEPAAVTAPVASAPLPAEVAAVASQAGASEPVGAPDAAAAVAEPPKPARNPKRVTTKARPAVANKAPEPATPAKAPEPAPAPPVLDPGGHSGFAPKCRWVTPVKWSCD